MSNTNKIVHFAIHADDLGRARQFYSRVFGWQFEGFGSPDLSTFCKIKTSTEEEPGPIGAMQHRKFNSAPEKMLGYECSVEVDDIDATAQTVEASGGKIVMPKTAIPGVGWVLKFLDTEGNLACAIRFDAAAA